MEIAVESKITIVESRGTLFPTLSWYSFYLLLLLFLSCYVADCLGDSCLFIDSLMAALSAGRS
jgi:hypothetical protein